MSTMPANREWMTAPQASPEYLDGIKSFLLTASKNPGNDGWHCCPCVDCKNMKGKKRLSDVRDHLVCRGIDTSYTTWFFHGEPFPYSDVNNDVPSTSSSAPRLLDLVDDVVNPFRNDDQHVSPNTDQDEPNAQNENEGTKYKKLKEDAVRPLYPSCPPGKTKLSATIELMNLKDKYQVSDNFFTEMLQTVKSFMPEENSLPENTHNAKTMLKTLGMECISIDACRNDCILYWKEHAGRDSCPECKESRWQSKYLESRGSRVPWKVLRYFPLGPRLQRLYSIPWVAKKMKWHKESVEEKDCMRHPKDSSSWTCIDKKWPGFANSQNVRLGLATDGFNPFGNMNNAHSCWPVMIVPYNLPPSLCMKKEFTMLTLLIPGKHEPGHEIDVYLRPLIDELIELWTKGILTYDSHEKKEFTLKAVLLWAIHDFPAYGHLSGCRTAGKYACPVCSIDTDSIWLKYGKKFSYMSMRRFLVRRHKFRSQKRSFNGKEEHRQQPRRLSGEQVLSKMKNIQTEFGKKNKKRKRSTQQEDGTSAWSKRSIFFDLPYWKELPIRHNLDVMHVEKNVAEILIATIMGTKDKTKDGDAARKDLEELRIKQNLWLDKDTRKPPKAPFALSDQEKKEICQILHDLKVPIGYSSNWNSKVNMEDFQLKNLKSHDYHILMQQLLPVLLMHAYKGQKPLRAAISQLSTFFNVLCSKVIHRKLLTTMKERVIVSLCVFEKYFPPSFFVSMIHLVVHLAEEALACGPVRFRWMYPFERMMRTYKRYVKNKTHPEGCIVERYLVEESTRYAMEYMPNDRKGKKKKRVDDNENDEEGCIGAPMDKKGKRYTLSHLQYEQVRKWLLQQSPDNFEWERKHQLYVKEHTSTRTQKRRSGAAIEKPLPYIPWLRSQLKNQEMSAFKRLAEGPSFEANSYEEFVQNGYIFCTSKSEMTRTTQNSGVCMQAITSFRASAKDKNLVEKEVTYYGIVRQILELDYFDFKEVVFYCDWVRIEDKVNGCLVDPNTNLIFVNLERFKSTCKEVDEPFISSSEASQVFYCKDPTRDNWYVVIDSPKRLTRGVDAYADPFVFEAKLKGDALVEALVLDVEGDNIDDNE